MNFIFDFDGTICDSFPVVIKIINEYLSKRHQKPIHADYFREKGIEELIMEYKLSKLQILAYVYFSRHEFGKHFGETKVFPKMTKVIRELSVSNCLAIVSSNSRNNIEKFLEINKISKYFKFVKTSSSFFGKARVLRGLKPDYYVGDEVRDVMAAKKAGVKSISVTWGFANKELLKTARPDFLIERPNGLLQLGKQLLH